MISDNFLELAIETAKTSPSRRKIGAVLLKKSKVVATAVNLEKKTHPWQAKLAKKVGLCEKIYLHAEVSALIKAKEDADTIVVARVNTQNKLRMAKPCPICAFALEQAGITNIYYTTNEGFMYKYSPDVDSSETVTETFATPV
jgi:tRNA(Arg) A34 adenosine deaminase TadA